MARAHLFYQLAGKLSTSILLTPLVGASVSVCEPGTATPISVTIYSGPSGIGTLSNPLTADSVGTIDFYLEKPKRVTLVVTAASYAGASVTADVGELKFFEYDPDDYGAKGDLAADDTSALLAMIADMPAGATARLPLTYLVSASLDTGNKFINWKGDKGLSKIQGAVNGPLIKMGTSGSNLGPVVDGLVLNNTHAAGMGVQVGFFVSAAIRNCGITAYRGIWAPGNTFTLHLDSCRLVGLAGFPSGGIGILSGGHALISGCDVVGFDNGIRAFGSGVSIHGGRHEVNVIGLNLGIDDTGASNTLARSDISGMSFEANDEAIRIQNLSSSTVKAIGIQGSVGSPSAQSTYGIRITTGSFTGVGIEDITIGGSFSQWGFSAVAGVATNVTLKDLNVANTLGGTWSFNNPHLFTHINTNWAAMAFPVASPTQLAADQNDYNPSPELNWRLSSNAQRTITGIANGVSGREQRIFNVGAQNIVLANQNAGSAVGNRIITGTGADVTLAADASATLIYDGTTLRWRIAN